MERLQYARDVEQRLILSTGHDLGFLEQVSTDAYVLQDGLLINRSEQFRQGRTLGEFYDEYLG